MTINKNCTLLAINRKSGTSNQPKTDKLIMLQQQRSSQQFLPQESEQLRSTPAGFLSATATEKDLFSTRLMFLPNGASAHWNLYGLAKQNEASVEGERAHRAVIHVLVAHCSPPGPPRPPHTHTHLTRLYCHRCTSAASLSVNTVRLFRCKNQARRANAEDSTLLLVNEAGARSS